MSVFEIGIIIFMSYIGAYGFLHRICECVEKCAMIKYTAEWSKTDKNEKKYKYPETN